MKFSMKNMHSSIVHTTMLTQACKEHSQENEWPEEQMADGTLAT
jgi:hypothetical protein